MIAQPVCVSVCVFSVSLRNRGCTALYTVYILSSKELYYDYFLFFFFSWPNSCMHSTN